MITLFDGSRFGDAHTTSNIILLDTSSQQSHLISSICFIKDLVKTLNTSHLTLARLGVSDYLNILSNLKTKIYFPFF